MSHNFPHQYVNLCSKVLQQLMHHDYIMSTTSTLVVGHKSEIKINLSLLQFG